LIGPLGQSTCNATGVAARAYRALDQGIRLIDGAELSRMLARQEVEAG
jgi:diketogulonate reductase-like aldo/keto reductase